MIDFAKAFNRINHNIIITILSEMGVPGWLLHIVIGFLSDRDMILRYKGGCSSKKALPGGGPQGTRLGLFLFIILINAEGLPYLEKHMGKHMTQKLCKRTPLDNMHMKNIDDMAMVESNMKKSLISNPDPCPPQPFLLHDRTNHLLPTEKLQLQVHLDNLVAYCSTNEIKLNKSKSKVMIFNTSRKYDGTPKLTVQRANE